MKFGLTIALLTVSIPAQADAAPPTSLPARPAEDVARDAARKPAEVLAFAGIRRGQQVGDFVMGGGYFTKVLAAAVGPTGKVYAFQPDEFVTYRAAYGTEQDAVAAAWPNVVPLRAGFAAPGFPMRLDAIVTIQNWHDTHLQPFPADTAARAAARLYAALKPRGTLVVIDHAAAAGSGLRDADRLHRIDPAAARAEIERAGFRFVAESPLFANPADPRTASVFDPAIRGRTDQFMMKFTKR